MNAYCKSMLLPGVAAALFWAQVLLPAWAKDTGLRPDAQLERGIATAQTCEAELDDDLTPYGECIGHAADRLTRQNINPMGLYFQAWLIADLAARQGSTRAAQLRMNYQRAVMRNQRSSALTVQQLCKVKNLDCSIVQKRLKQNIPAN